ncbi:hypothetical protein K456DRAFT_1719498 [Colletotrichum gloeosporioides 23]|nr:hypothetical protein K456DRAFT_1719498 [Colletotrichum gloeosporioides 23]
MRNASNTSHQKVYYQHHITAEESGSPISDILGIQTLFWLAVGCLPLSNVDLYSLENCIIQQEVEETVGSRPFHQRTVSGATHRTHFEDDGDYDLVDMSFVARRASSYAISTEPKRQERHMSPRDPRVFRFSSVKERVEELARVASSLEQPDQAGNVYSLEEVDVPDDVARQLKESLGGTYHPISSNFVRLGKAGTYEDYAKSLPIFLERSSSQLLAKGLLDLPLSPEGYLVGFPKDSWCRTTLCNSAQLLPHLLTRICNDLDHLQVPESSKNDFIAIADKLLVLCLNYQPTRTFYQTIYSLDIILQELLPLNAKAMASVGVVTITSAEFRDFLTSVVRMIPESTGKSVTLDLGPASTLNVPSVMGVIQKYPVDITQIFPGENISIEAVEIRFHHLIFAALKACLRSTVLETSLDSTPLFEAFLQMNEVVHMG